MFEKTSTKCYQSKCFYSLKFIQLVISDIKYNIFILLKLLNSSWTKRFQLITSLEIIQSWPKTFMKNFLISVWQCVRVLNEIFLYIVSWWLQHLDCLTYHKLTWHHSIPTRYNDLNKQFICIKLVYSCHFKVKVIKFKPGIYFQNAFIILPWTLLPCLSPVLGHKDYLTFVPSILWILICNSFFQNVDNLLSPNGILWIYVWET